MNAARPFIRLPLELNVCRHGKPLRTLTTHPSVGRWLVWGHYDCEDCDVEVLHHSADRCGEAFVADRSLPISLSDDALPPQF